ncbi:hypothetical protein M231_00375 [Tremella mesenterica]|uniref:Uncharacterized protein n=1 Tax=Tremella mesenterica TaxID=5217 RepID=A0A4Q1BW54_TREME|nr:hypothetical protein M231_00375 [Tremella mesenterica]
MTTLASSGPSSLDSSPVVPSTARNLRISRRVINLVNPADPGDFSEISLSPAVSPNASSSEPLRSEIRIRETTPLGTVNTNIAALTPGVISEHGPKGILRQTGTPGSGNGVRFFPKNKFRVITPNNSVTPKPPASPTSSFFSQLIAATIPSMSPRKGRDPADESWELPGQEGEVSLAGSMTSERSCAESARSFDRGPDGETETSVEELEVWDGVPQTHSSPLGLNATLDRSTSMREDSVDWKNQIPDDMSNLLSQGMPSMDDSFSFSPTNTLPNQSPRIPDLSYNDERLSFSQNQPPTPPTVRAGPQQLVPPVAARIISPSPLRNMSMYSEGSTMSDGPIDDNPTIRRHISPLGLSAPIEPVTPTPGTGKGFTGSIFADMSAEQAQLTWPLVRNDDETMFHSAVFTDDVGVLTPTHPSAFTQSTSPKCDVKTPGNSSRGDVTQFFDCDTTSPATFSNSLIRTPSPLPPSLLRPTQQLMEAHSAHATAILSELNLYRDLAQRLQAEVTERDGALAELNLRALEGDMLRVQLDDLRTELRREAIRRTSPPSTSMLGGGIQEASGSSREESASPSPLVAKMRRDRGIDHPGDRTTIAQAENRDLEIRLSKALADQSEMARQVQVLQDAKSDLHHQVETLQREIQERDEESQDRLVAQRQMGMEASQAELTQAQQRNDELNRMLADVQLRAEDAECQLRELEMDQQNGELERIRDESHALKEELKQIKEVKGLGEEEIFRLHGELDKFRGVQKREEGLKVRLTEMEQGLQTEMKKNAELSQSFQAEKKRCTDLETHLTHAVQEAEGQKAQWKSENDKATKTLREEIAKLRAESASKDLEILNLHKRKEELKEDREMLNIALDSKQQELELIKRKFAVKGVAGCTPLGNSRMINTPSITDQTPIARPRKISMTLSTPLPGGIRGNRLSGVSMRSSELIGRTLRSKEMRESRGSMSKVDEENRPPRQNPVGSMRRQRVMA